MSLEVLLIAPQAPFTLDLGLVQGFAWYDMNEVGTPHQETFARSLGLLRNFLSEVKAAYPVDPQRIFLLGFSQGTVMAYATALLEPKSVAGVAALSGYVPANSGLPLKLQDIKGFPIFISHGTYDDIIPVQFGRESRDLLKKSGANVEYHEYPMGHEVRQETLVDLAAWIHRILPNHK
jgi:phospholipase/carboxylesterase